MVSGVGTAGTASLLLRGDKKQWRGRAACCLAATLAGPRVEGRRKGGRGADRYSVDVWPTFIHSPPPVRGGCGHTRSRSPAVVSLDSVRWPSHCPPRPRPVIFVSEMKSGMRGEEEQHTAHQSLLTTVLTPDMSRVTPGELQPGSSAGPGQEEGNQWLAGYGCVVPGGGGRGEGCELDQAANYPNCRAAVAAAGCLGGHRAHICSRIIPAAGNRWLHGTAPWHRARSIYPHKDDTIRHNNTAGHTTAPLLTAGQGLRLN